MSAVRKAIRLDGDLRCLSLLLGSLAVKEQFSDNTNRALVVINDRRKSEIDTFLQWRSVRSARSVAAVSAPAAAFAAPERLRQRTAPERQARDQWK